MIYEGEKIEEVKVGKHRGYVFSLQWSRIWGKKKTKTKKNKEERKKKVQVFTSNELKGYSKTLRSLALGPSL